MRVVDFLDVINEIGKVLSKCRQGNYISMQVAEPVQCDTVQYVSM